MTTFSLSSLLSLFFPTPLFASNQMQNLLLSKFTLISFNFNYLFNFFIIVLTSFLIMAFRVDLNAKLKSLFHQYYQLTIVFLMPDSIQHKKYI